MGMGWSKRTVRAITGAAMVLVFLIAGASASCDERGQGDAPVGQEHEAKREVWNAPDSFSNVVAFCVGLNGTYVTTKGAMRVIPNDPNCEEGGELNDDGE